MTTRVETMSALATISWAKPFDTVGEDELEAGGYAILLGDDEIVAIVGTADQLENAGLLILRAVQEIAKHAARPLAHADFVYDANMQAFLCPRCGDNFSIGHQEGLAIFVQQIDAHIDIHRPEHER